MPIFGGAISTTMLVLLECPRCGEKQARVRVPEGERFECRACHATFSLDEGRTDEKRIPRGERER